MQHLHLRKPLYQTTVIDESLYSAEALKRASYLKKAEAMKKEGCSEKTILEVLGISRASFYRYKKRFRQAGYAGLEDKSKRPHRVRKPSWTKEAERLVYQARKKYPVWGKEKIHAYLVGKGKLSTPLSTVGRILKALLERGLIKPVSFYSTGKVKQQRRSFNGSHAKRWRYGMKSHKPGELIQVDHMTVTLPNGKVVKNFQAICPVTKQLVSKVYTAATSELAADFLKEIQNRLPFKVLSLQVDGGSEFMGAFEESCKAQQIPLYVLPPRRPQYNAHVERSNATTRYEFFNLYTGPISITALRKAQEAYLYHYHYVRPHKALKNLTPAQFYSQLTKSPKKSHML